MCGSNVTILSSADLWSDLPLASLPSEEGDDGGGGLRGQNQPSQQEDFSNTSPHDTLLTIPDSPEFSIEMSPHGHTSVLYSDIVM